MQNTERPATPTRAPDRRVRRTREALRIALLDLLVERGWDAIDVQSLCERADVGRSTFYLHYEDRTALLRGAFDDLRRSLLAEAAGCAEGDAFPFLPALLAHVQAQRRVFRALLGRRGGQVVRDQFEALLVTLFTTGLPDGDAPAHLPPHPAARLRGRALAGALFQVLVDWLGAGEATRSADDIEAWFRRFAAGTDAVVVGAGSRSHDGSAS